MKSIIFVLTKAPYGKSESEEAMHLVLEGLKKGDTISIYLLSDAVLLAKNGQRGRAGKAIEEVISHGAKVYASRAELLSRGVSESGIIPGVVLPEDLLGALVEDAMERADSTLSF